jgi:hypothetical protein
MRVVFRKAKCRCAAARHFGHRQLGTGVTVDRPRLLRRAGRFDRIALGRLGDGEVVFHMIKRVR